MITILHKFLSSAANALMLESYGWQRRKGMFQGKLTVQWQDPNSMHWYSEKTALRLLHVQALEHFYNSR